MTNYVGDSRNVVRRIKNQHYSSNVEGSSLRFKVAEALGYSFTLTRRPNGSIKKRIDLPNPHMGELFVSHYLRAGYFKYILCASYEMAHDFQFFVIQQLNPVLNTNVGQWNQNNWEMYHNLFNQLMNSPPILYNQMTNLQTGPGIYVHFHQMPPTLNN